MAKRYSTAEKRVIQDEIIRNPTNLLESFDNASKKLKDRSAKSIQQQWYKTLRYQKQIFFLRTASITIANTKNIPR
jgi:hypothetical protein